MVALRDLLFDNKKPEIKKPKGKITDIHYEKHDVSPRLSVQGMSSASGFERLMDVTTRLVNQTNGYNPDIEPWQNPVLQLSQTSIKYRRVREEVYKYSEFIRKQTERIFYDIIMRGWRITRKTDQAQAESQTDNTKSTNFKTNDPKSQSKTKSNIPEKNSKIEKHAFGETEPKKNKEEDKEDPTKIREGYEEVGEEEFPTFTNDLLLKLIEAMSKSVFIDTAYIAMLGYKYQVFTSNDVFRPFGDSNRNPTEVYFHYPQDEAMLYEGDEVTGDTKAIEKHFTNEKLGYLLQDCPQEDRQRRIYTPNVDSAAQKKGVPVKYDYDGRSNEIDDKIYRECVQITPYKSIKSVYGESLLLRQGHTALGLIYLNFLSMLRAHKGGKDRFLVYPAGASEDYKDIMKRAVRRGMMTRGVAVGYDGGNPAETFMIEESEIPDLKEDNIRKILTAGGIISRQLSEGTPESGALGGSAPEASERIDEHTKSMYYLALEDAIRNIYWVFYGIPRYKHETEQKEEDEYTSNKNGKEIKKIKNGSSIEEKEDEEEFKLEPAYEIEFFVQDMTNPDEENLDNPADQEAGATGNDKQGTSNQKDKVKPKNKSNEINSSLIGNINEKKALQNKCIFEKHSVETIKGKEYVVYQGNLFNPGEYKYEDRGDGAGSYKVQYNVTDIQEMTQNPVDIKDLEFTHTNDHLSTGLGDNNYGFIKIVGFDNITNRDITKIHILKDRNQELIDMGVIYKDENNSYKVELSPYLVRRPKADGGQKLLILNTAIVDPRNDRTMSEVSGLGSTSATTNKKEN